MNHNTNTRGIRETQELADVGQERKEDAPPPYEDLSDSWSYHLGARTNFVGLCLQTD